MKRLFAMVLATAVATQLFAETPDENPEDKRAEDLLKKADLKYDVREFDEAIDMYKNLIDRFPKSKYRYTARLRLGKHFFKEKQYNDAIGHLHECAEASQSPDEQAEALYLIGVSNYEQGQYQKTFSELRKVTANFPGTEYCNKAYHYIGMAHFQMKHYKRAIEAFQMVGTSVEKGSENVRKLSPGKRLFVRVNDRDLTILSRQKKTLTVDVETKTGDKEKVELHSRGLTGTDFIGSIKTELGEPKPSDEALQLIGTDEISINYVDTHASNRQRDIARSHKITMADDACADIVDGIYKNRVNGVALERYANFRVIDYDRDLGAARDSVEVIVRAKREIKDEAGKVVKEEDLISREKGEKEKKYEILDEERLKLEEQANEDISSIATPSATKETGAGKEGAGAAEAKPKEGAGTKPKDAGAAKPEEAKPKEPTPAPEKTGPKAYHSGIFVGNIPVKTGDPKKGDNVLTAEMNDMIEVEYVDQVRLTGEKPETLKSEVVVVKGHITVPLPYQSSIKDPSLKVKTELQVAEALMHMGRIYKELGLKEQADDKFDEALKECAKVGRERQGAFDRELLEQTQYLLWKIYFEKGDHQSAATVCLNLLRNFPNSDFADDALMMMGNVAKEKGEHTQAISYYQRLIQAAPTSATPPRPGEPQVIGSPLAPDAQYAIAECYESMGMGTQGNKSYLERALVEYKKCAELFPMSKFAPKAITKIANFYYQVKDYTRALEIYDKTLRDYPDAEFIDLILLNYGKCLVMMKDYPGASVRFRQVIEEHPESQYVDKAKKYDTYCRKKITGGKATPTEGESEESKEGGDTGGTPK